MPLMEWSPALSVKVARFDAQHKALVELVNGFYDATRTGRDQGMLDSVLQQLVSYSIGHFDEEETAMMSCGYPDLHGHRAEHEEFGQVMLALQREMLSGVGSLSIPLLQFLVDWLVNHIGGSDKQYGDFLNSKGIY